MKLEPIRRWFYHRSLVIRSEVHSDVLTTVSTNSGVVGKLTCSECDSGNGNNDVLALFDTHLW